MKREVVCQNDSCPSVVNYAAMGDESLLFRHVMLADPASGRCPACKALDTLVTLREADDDRRFPIGVLVVTPGVAALCSDVLALGEIVDRHARGDWGDGDALANDRALGLDSKPLDRQRLVSIHSIAGTPVWIITEAGRHTTTVLLPEEY